MRGKEHANGFANNSVVSRFKKAEAENFLSAFWKDCLERAIKAVYSRKVQFAKKVIKLAFFLEFN